MCLTSECDDGIAIYKRRVECECEQESEWMRHDVRESESGCACDPERMRMRVDNGCGDGVLVCLVEGAVLDDGL